MDTKEHESGKLLLRDEVYQLVGCAIEVLNGLGHGFHEKPYERAMVVEFGLRGIPWMQQPEFDINYKDHKIGSYIPDLIAFSEIIIDTKTIDRITDLERGQVLNYLKITGLQVGLIINFSKPKLEWERLVL